MALNYAWEKFFEAMHTAFLADVPIRKRLELALFGLHTLRIPDDWGLDLPPELNERFHAMWTMCSRSQIRRSQIRLASSALSPQPRKRCRMLP